MTTSHPCNCNQGHLPCPMTCECRRVGMWDDERAYPRLAVALYLGAFALAIVGSIVGALLRHAA